VIAAAAVAVGIGGLAGVVPRHLCVVTHLRLAAVATAAIVEAKGGHALVPVLLRLVLQLALLLAPVPALLFVPVPVLALAPVLVLLSNLARAQTPAVAAGGETAVTVAAGGFPPRGWCLLLALSCTLYCTM